MIQDLGPPVQAACQAPRFCPCHLTQFGGQPPPRKATEGLSRTRPLRRNGQAAASENFAQDFSRALRADLYAPSWAPKSICDGGAGWAGAPHGPLPNRTEKWGQKWGTGR